MYYDHEPVRHMMSVRITKTLNDRINAEVNKRRKEHHSHWNKPTLSSVVVEWLTAALDKIDRERAQQRELEV